MGDRIKEHGYVSGEEKKQIFAESDIMILPSYGEGMPVVIMEAMASGQALVVTPVGAVPEIVKNGVNAYYIQPGDVEGTMSVLKTVLDDKESLFEMFTENVKRGAEFNLESNVKDLCNLYKGVRK